MAGGGMEGCGPGWRVWGPRGCWGEREAAGPDLVLQRLALCMHYLALPIALPPPLQEKKQLVLEGHSARARLTPMTLLAPYTVLPH